MNTITVTKASIKQCIKNSKRLKWKPKRIAETLHYLGFGDKEIGSAMKSYKLPCGCLLKTNDINNATQKCMHGNIFAEAL